MFVQKHSDFSNLRSISPYYERDINKIKMLQKQLAESVGTIIDPNTNRPVNSLILMNRVEGEIKQYYIDYINILIETNTTPAGLYFGFGRGPVFQENFRVQMLKVPSS